MKQKDGICAVHGWRAASKQSGGSSKYVCLQWPTVGSEEETHDVEEKTEDRGAVKAGEWFEDFSFQSRNFTGHIVWADIAVSPFTREFP